MELGTQTSRPQIFEYESYRTFLRDIYQFNKQTNRHFSFRYFAKRAGFTSPNFLKLVIEGKRNISQESTPRFIEALKLSKSEAIFFEHLVNFEQAKTSHEKSRAADAMLNAKGFAKIHPLRQAEYSYYAKWFYIAVRELVSIPQFEENPDWIAKTLRPQITSSEATTAIKDLELMGLLIRDSHGRLQQTQKSLNTENEVNSTAIVQYHQQMMRLASESIERIPRSEREISAACVPVSHQTAQKIKLMIQNFRQELLAIANEDSNPETVCQINIQMFPLSKNEEPDL